MFNHFWFILCSSVCSHTLNCSCRLWFFVCIHFIYSFYLHSFLLGFPYDSSGKEFACNAEDLDSIPRLGRSPGEGKGYPLQYSGLENSIVFCNIVIHRITESWTWLSDFHFHFIYICSFFFIYNLIYLSFFVMFWLICLKVNDSACLFKKNLNFVLTISSIVSWFSILFISHNLFYLFSSVNFVLILLFYSSLRHNVRLFISDPFLVLGLYCYTLLT